jgi:hypothetical protein
MEKVMGTEIRAFIEYDLTTEGAQERHPGLLTKLPPAFSEASQEIYSVTEAGGIYTGSKDYRFFGAIAGVRNETGITPLFPPRGVPPNPSPELRRYFNSKCELGGYADSWLSLSEINAALDHQSVDRKLLSFETHTILAIMDNLAGRLGDDRVRLVFGFDS